MTKRYVNNRGAAEPSGHNATDFGGTFLWRVQPRTYATFNSKQTIYGVYNESLNATFGSTNTFGPVGLRWDARAATSRQFAGRRGEKPAWTHAWTRQISSKLMTRYATDKFSNFPIAAAGNADRSDTTKNLGLHLTYEMRRWLELGMDYPYTTRDSNDPASQYKCDQLMFFVSGTL